MQIHRPSSGAWIPGAVEEVSAASYRQHSPTPASTWILSWSGEGKSVPFCSQFERFLRDRTDSALPADCALSVLAQTARIHRSNVGSTLCASDARTASDAAHG